MNPPKVSEIFKAAGDAFNMLGEMTMQLHNQSDGSSKWSEEDVNSLQSAITNFGQDLNKISVKIKNRTASQIRQTLTKQAYEEAGIRVQQVNVPPLHHIQPVKYVRNGQIIQHFQDSEVVLDDTEIIEEKPVPASPSSSEVMMTLNRLNAHEEEEIELEEEEEDEEHLDDDYVEEVVIG